MKKWFSKRDKLEDCMTNCNFCHTLITKEEPGLILKTAQFYHWKCLLRLKDSILDLERKLNQKRDCERE